MKVYVASSWRNDRQQEVVRILREAGHDVYDFKNPAPGNTGDFKNPAPGNTGFSWRSCATPEQLKDARLFRSEVLTHPIAQRGFQLDMMALMDADATVLVLLCGRSAHLELGYAVGKGQLTCVLYDNPISEPELTHLMCDVTAKRLCVSMDEVLAVLRGER